MQRLTTAEFSPALRAWFQRGRHHSIGGRRVFVLDTGGPAHGERAPLLVLHGFPTSSFDFHRVLPLIEPSRRVVLVDLPGSGFSDKPERYSYSLFEQTDVVEGLCAKLGLARPHVVAHDLGVNVACELLARRQRALLKGDLGSLFLMSSGLYQDLAKITPSQKMLLTPLGPGLAGLAVGAVFKLQIQQVFARRVSKQDVDAMWEQILHLDGHKRLPQIASYLLERARFEERWTSALRTSEDVPVRLLWGSRDPTAVVAIGERLAEQIPGAELVRLRGVGHYPQLEAVSETADAVLRFADEVEAGWAAKAARGNAGQPKPAQAS
jgi:pimeloyl-ACP methyl ester carboxylesterase